jgi:hypothetical protein
MKANKLFNKFLDPSKYNKYYSEKYFFSPRLILLAVSGLTVCIVIVFVFYYLPYRKYKPMKFEREYSFIIQDKMTSKGYLYVNDSLQIPPLYSKSDTAHMWIHEFIFTGDSLVKRKNSFLVSVIREGQSYLFSPGGE